MVVSILCQRFLVWTVISSCWSMSSVTTSTARASRWNMLLRDRWGWSSWLRTPRSRSSWSSRQDHRSCSCASARPSWTGSSWHVSSQPDQTTLSVLRFADWDRWDLRFDSLFGGGSPIWKCWVELSEVGGSRMRDEPQRKSWDSLSEPAEGRTSASQNCWVEQTLNQKPFGGEPWEKWFCLMQVWLP